MPEYTYLQQRDILQVGDEYHQCGSGLFAIWISLSADDEAIGKPKRALFSHSTRVRRRTGPPGDGSTQQEMF